jgi:uncharacterized OsmC-like protein
MSNFQSETVNRVEWEHLRESQSTVTPPPAERVSRVKVATRWEGGTHCRTRMAEWEIGGAPLSRQLEITVGGTFPLDETAAPNPQELLLAAFNACMIMEYAAGCALEGIELKKLIIETQGELDLRGLQGLDPSVKPGYDALRYTVLIAGKGTREQFEAIHQRVMSTSPNRWNLANSVKLKTEFIVECPQTSR